jgi:UDP-N-acetylmuramoylalanine--D-glutamate ligase
VITAQAFAGKRYAVLGLARSGLTVVASLAASGAQVVAWDDREAARSAVTTPGVEFADLNTIGLAGFDAIIVSPGVPLNTHPLAKRAAEAGVPVIGDIELFALARPELPPHKVVGITGTNGKSTTTALIHHLLVTAGIPARLGGNIGLPILGQAPLEAGGVYVLELSSFQIDLTRSLDCDVAVVLNITPDHLDRYDGFDGYAASKARLLEMQSAEGVAIISMESRASRALAAAQPKAFGISAADINDQSAWPTLQGPHNAENVAAACAAALHLGASPAAIAEGLTSYPGLPHRMERIATKRGVLYVNDSKATNPTSTAPALAAYPKIHWICGGLNKTDELDACLPYLGHVKAAYTIGKAEELFANILRSHVRVEQIQTVVKATQLAASRALPGEVILLSPACASYDQFRDFEARGDAFREAVGGLPE